MLDLMLIRIQCNYDESATSVYYHMLHYR